MMRGAGLASISGDIAWILLWVCCLLTHGPGPEDRKGALFQLTSLDYAKFMVIPVSLMAWGMQSLHSRQQAKSGRVGQMGFVNVMAAYTLMAVTIVFSLWPLPWGANRDEVDFQAPLTKYPSALNGLSTIVLALAMILFSIGVVKAKVWPAWIVLPLNVSSLAAVRWLHETPWGGLTGLAWLVLGYVISVRGSQTVERAL
jgi:hypothetical protein